MDMQVERATVQFDKNDPSMNEKIMKMIGPEAPDQMIRQVICLCRMMLPEEKRTVAGVEAEVRRLVERALKDLRDDATAFGVPPASPPASPSLATP
jgi:hypothetical protein